MTARRYVRLHCAFARSYLGYVFKRTKPPMPCFFNVDPCSACNFRCVFCPQSDPPRNMKFGLMNFELFDHVIEEIHRSTICAGMSLYLSGEPLLNKDLPRMVRLVRDRLETRPEIATNGMLLTREVAQSLIESGVGSFLIDFCADPVHYETVCPPGNWEQVRANIQALGEAVRSSGARVNVYVKDLDWRGETAEERLGSHRALQAVFGTTYPFRYMEYRLHNWSGEFSAKAEERYGYRRTGDGKRLRYNPCSHLWFMMNIHYDGKVSICCRDAMQGAVVGDVRENSLPEIWNGPAMVKMRELMINKEYDRIPVCRYCDRIWMGSYSGGSPLRIAKVFFRGKIRMPIRFRRGFRRG